MPRNYYNSDSDNDDDEYNFERQEKWKSIKHFTINDYLECNETRIVLEQNWNQDFEDTEKELYDLFDKLMEYIQNNQYDFLSLADNVHASDFVSLIRHHLERNYDVSIFENDPDLANPLIKKYDDIKKEREYQRRLMNQSQLKQSNKSFDWNTKKYK